MRRRVSNLYAHTLGLCVLKSRTHAGVLTRFHMQSRTHARILAIFDTQIWPECERECDAAGGIVLKRKRGANLGPRSLKIPMNCFLLPEAQNQEKQARKAIFFRTFLDLHFGRFWMRFCLQNGVRNRSFGSLEFVTADFGQNLKIWRQYYTF